jgi:hypothetical protein
MATTEYLQPADGPSPVAIIREAIASGKSPEFLRELLNVRREWEADEARKAFNLAIAEFQRRAPIIEKADKAYDKQYARMDRIWREIRPLLTELGLSVTWQVCELRDQLCHVEGQLRHLVDAARGVAGFNEKAFYGWLGTDDLAMVPANRHADVVAMLKRKIGGAK